MLGVLVWIEHAPCDAVIMEQLQWQRACRSVHVVVVLQVPAKITNCSMNICKLGHHLLMHNLEGALC